MTDLKDCSKWWNGPDSKVINNYDVGPFERLEDIPERRLISMNSTTHADITIFNQFSNLDKLVNVFAYCRRFIHNCKNSNKLVDELADKERTSFLK